MMSKISLPLDEVSRTTDRLGRTARFALASSRAGWQSAGGDLRLTAIATAAA